MLYQQDTGTGPDDLTEHDFELMRRAMVTGQLRTNAVNDARVVAAMASVPRELYAPASAIGISYTDRPLPIGHGRMMPPPMVTGRLITEARVRANESVLVIGAASGYAAAVLARLAARVIALEEADIAAGPTAQNVARVQGPLVAGWPDAAPYDVILIDGAVDEVPPALVDQLAEGGRIATGLVRGGFTRLAIGRRSGDSFGLSAFADAEVPVLPGFAQPAGFRF